MKPLQVLLAIFACAFLPLHAASLDDLTYSTTNGEVTITDCDTTATGELVIPDTIGGNPVTSIANFSFSQCRNLESITIPDSVNSIGTFAFFNCTSLTSITIPEGVTSIQNSVFASCRSLPSITIPDSVTSIGDFTFYNCASLTSITLPENLTSIGEEAFDECANLGTVIFQGPAPTVGNDAFAGLPTSANALVKVGNLSSFGAKFSNWNGLTVDTILAWTTNSGEVTITDCDKAATGELIIPNTIGGNPVTSIGNYAFRDCNALTEITIPDGVTSLGVGTFFESTGLTKVTLPEGILTLPLYTFYGCRSLVDITIPDSVSTLGGYAFAECTNLTNIQIPDGVTSIGNLAFYTCAGLTAITIPSSVASIDTWAFYNCTRLTNVTFRGAAPTTNREPFLDVPGGARALVPIEVLSSFGSFGNDWEGLTLSPIPEQEAYLAPLIAERDAARAERDARPTAEELVTVEAARDARPTQAAYDAAVVTARTAGQGDVTSDPASYGLVTQASYNAVVAERDARFTEDQINAMTTDPTIGRNAAGNMQVDISFIHSTDLQTFTPFAVNPAWVSVVDGKITLEFPPSNENTFFYRLGVQ